MGDSYRISLSDGRNIEVPASANLLTVVRQSGIDLPAICGGAGLCGKCMVRFLSGAPDPTTDDLERIEQNEIDRGCRLACRALITRDAEIELMPVSPPAAADILIDGHRPAIQPDPWVRKHLIESEPHEISTSSSDLQKIFAGSQPAWLALPALQRLPELLREGNFRGTVTLLDGEFIDFETGDQRDACYGLAVDLGTTTVALKLIHLPTGRIVASRAALNLQSRYGGDVISRIQHANENPEGLSALQNTIISQINGMIGSLVVNRGHIYEMVVAGNAVMQHLLLAVPPRFLGEMPYIPAFTSSQRLKATELGIDIHPQGRVYVMPAIGRFVGGDTSAVLLTLAERLQETWLAVDIGTNGEVLLCHRGRLWATSAAAGPAFEGAQISQGMRATAGAIDRVWWQQEGWKIHTIGDERPRGICGSGLIDAIGSMLESGALDNSGRLLVADPAQAYVELARSEGEAGVRISQRDIREVQLAKGAIAAAVEIVLHQAGLTAQDLHALYLAGAFGQYLRREMAMRIGLLPAMPLDRIHFIGNAACAGAEMALISSSAVRRIEELVERVEYVEVAADPAFQERFAMNMMFPVAGSIGPL